DVVKYVVLAHLGYHAPLGCRGTRVEADCFVIVAHGRNRLLDRLGALPDGDGDDIEGRGTARLFEDQMPEKARKRLDKREVALHRRLEIRSGRRRNGKVVDAEPKLGMLLEIQCECRHGSSLILQTRESTDSARGRPDEEHRRGDTESTSDGMEAPPGFQELQRLIRSTITPRIGQQMVGWPNQG